MLVSRYIKRIKRHDKNLTVLDLADPIDSYTDDELVKLMDTLIDNPNVVESVWLFINSIADQTGVKCAQYVAASFVVHDVDLSSTGITTTTCLALARSLHVNSSLKRLALQYNDAVDVHVTEAALVHALRINPDRPIYSEWYIGDHNNSFKRLKARADLLGHPTLQELLLGRHLCDKREISFARRK